MVDYIFIRTYIIIYASTLSFLYNLVSKVRAMLSLLGIIFLARQIAFRFSQKALGFVNQFADCLADAFFKLPHFEDKLKATEKVQL